MQAEEIRSVSIAYYTGTGNTRKVADCFEERFQDKIIEVHKFSVTDKSIQYDLKKDLLVVIYAVHALNAPEAIYRWIDKLPEGNGCRAVVISNSGGGEVLPNRACRVSCKKKLKRKGYDVVYENMIVMPSNWFVQTKEPLAIRLLEVLPNKVEQMIQDILEDNRRKTNPPVIDRLLSRLGELEKIGAKSFGKRIRCNDNCNGCGWCSRHCPAENIQIINNKATFQNRCHICLNCIYGCPKKALKPGIIGSVIIKQGYSIKELEEKVPNKEPIHVEELAKGYVWAGVKKYLMEDK